MKIKLFTLLALMSAFGVAAKQAYSGSDQSPVSELIAEQRHNLAQNTAGKGFGPQSPRDIDDSTGNNRVLFQAAPAYTEMNLCNIHFHSNAEHKGGEFTKFAGTGDGHGYGSGYQYSGQLSADELAPVNNEICPGEHGSLQPGATIETHYVFSTAAIKPGATLAACFSDASKNPQFRVEAQVYVLVNDPQAADFGRLTRFGLQQGRYQALHIPATTGIAVQYAGSTTGPAYNEAGSPFQVSWSVRPKVQKVNIASVGQWCQGNAFAEDHAHAVRNLVLNPALLSPIAQ